MREDQLLTLPSQGTIYSVSRLGNHLIMGSGECGKVFAHIGTNSLQQLPLQNLPYDADVVSLDAYIDAFPVLAVAYVQKCSLSAHGAVPDGKGRDGYVTAHLNIYSTWISVDQDSPTSTSSTSSDGSKFKPIFHPKEEFHSSQFELLAQNCTIFQLDYIPFHLYHIPVVKENGNFGNILLLSGSDRRIHALEADEDNLTFVEIAPKTYFPELSQTFPDIVTRILIQPASEPTRRITMCGMETGKVLIWVVQSKYHRRRFDSERTIISSSASFTGGLPSTSSMGSVVGTIGHSARSTPDLHSQPEEPNDEDEEESYTEEVYNRKNFMSKGKLDLLDERFEILEHHYEGLITSIKSYTDGFNLNVIVASALSPTYVYTNCIEESFSLGSPLKFSGNWDAVECCCVADIDRDGENEIVIGTFGCTLLVYKYMDEILPEWVIVSKQQLPRSVLAIEFVNFDLHVVTALGLHIIKYDTCAYFTNKSKNEQPNIFMTYEK